jgi:two-component system sensor histidine kinase KdpD
MFYTGEGKIADGRRGLGLGLALCKSIVDAHGGTIFLRDNVPTGCCFCFTLPEVQINE